MVAGVNSKIQLYRAIADGRDKSIITDLRKSCAHHGHILAVNVRTYNDYIVVADLMKSISILQYEALSDSITEIARDYNTNWMTALEIIEDELILAVPDAPFNESHEDDELDEATLTEEKPNPFSVLKNLK